MFKTTMQNGQVVWFAPTEQEFQFEARAQPWDSATEDWDTETTFTQLTFRVTQMDDWDNENWQPSEDDVIAAYEEALRTREPDQMEPCGMEG